MSNERAARRRDEKALAKQVHREKVRERMLHVAMHERRNSAFAKAAKRPVRGIRPGETDTRDPKYLHSHARAMRGLAAAIGARDRGRPVPHHGSGP